MSRYQAEPVDLMETLIYAVENMPPKILKIRVKGICSKHSSTTPDIKNMLIPLLNYEIDEILRAQTAEKLREFSKTEGADIKYLLECRMSAYL